MSNVVHPLAVYRKHLAVIQPDSSEARNTTAFAISSVSIRPIGSCAKAWLPTLLRRGRAASYRCGRSLVPMLVEGLTMLPTSLLMLRFGFGWTRSQRKKLKSSDFFVAVSTSFSRSLRQSLVYVAAWAFDFRNFRYVPDDGQAHLKGRVVAALMAKAGELLSQPPKIEQVDVLAAKLP